MAEPADRPAVLSRHLVKGLMPGVPYYHCRRPALGDKFRRALASKIVWVCAPAGSGKTTFLCSYFAEKKQSVAWVSLDDHDNDVHAFWRSILVSLRRIVPHLADSVYEELCNDAPDVYDALSIIIDEIALKTPRVFIVLDDFHCIDSPDTRDSVIAFMRYLPSSAHLIVASRNEPPAQLNILKGHGELSEINAGDLRLSLQEASDMLAEFSEIALPAETVKALYDLTDGWVTSFKMAMIALQGSGDVDSLMGYLQKQTMDVMSCLVDEMLGHQEPEIRQFLLLSSIPQRFTAEMCTCVLGEGDCETKINTVLFRNLFLQPISDGAWYQYHSLFRRELLRRVRDEEGDAIAIYYRRICEWLEAHGRLEEALDYALDANDPSHAIEILDRISMVWLGKDNYSQFWSWLNRIPEDIVRDSFYANVGCATYYEMVRRPEIQRQHIDRALSLRPGPALSAAPLVAVLDTLRLYHADEFEAAIAEVEACLTMLAPDDAAGRCSVLTLKGMCHWRLGDLAGAYEACSEAARLGVEAQWAYSAGLNFSAVAHIRFQQLHLGSAGATCRELDAMNAQMTRDISSSGYAQMIQARIHYLQGTLAESASRVERALAIAEQSAEPVLWFAAQMALARLQLARGDVKGAKATASSAKVRSESAVADSRVCGMLMSRFWLMSGSVGIAADYLERWFGSCDPIALASQDAGCLLREHVYGDVRDSWAETPLFVWVRVKLAEGETGGLSELLGTVRRELERGHWRTLALEAIVLEALVAEKAGDLDTALALLGEALAATNDDRLPRLFADEGASMRRLCLEARGRGIFPGYAGEILEVFGGGAPAVRFSPPRASGPVRALSEREIAILELLCLGETNQAIADTLYLGLSTVKNHVYSIYRKLGTDNRAQTILRVQELGILEGRGGGGH